MRYFPILLSKAGEFKALQELNANITNDISPVIEVIPNSIPRVESKLISNWAFSGNQVLLDFSSYTQLSSDIQYVEQLFENLRNAGVNVIPVIQQGISSLYLTLVATLVSKYNYKVCIRSSNVNGGLINYMPQVLNLMGQVGISDTDTILLVDLGYAESHNYNNLSALAISILNSIQNPRRWLNIVLASGSFPVDVSGLLPANTVHRLTRYEWNIWNAINTNQNLKGIVKYGDYGNKNPVYGGEAPYAGSCSIKYTAVNEFVIYRGVKAEDHIDGNGQFVTFSIRLIRAPEYSGAVFSWGDAKITAISNEPLGNPLIKPKPGSMTTWVEITQNHHITLLHSLL